MVVDEEEHHLDGCGVHEKSSHVVDRACCSIGQLMNAKNVIVSTHEEDNP